MNQKWVAPSLNTTGDGSLYTTAHDLALWSIALDGDRVLGRAAKDASWSATKLSDGSVVDYGFGWKLDAIGTHRAVRHRGDWQGFTSHFLRLTDDRVTVVVLTNRSFAQNHVIAERIAAHYVPALASIRKAPILATALSSTPVYLRGSMNDWGKTDTFQPVEPGVIEARRRLDAGKHQFKVASEDWQAIELGAPYEQPEVPLAKTKPVESKGENFVLDVSEAGTYVFRLDARRNAHPKLTVRLEGDR